MVLLHALGQRGSSWTPVISRFAEHFRVHTLDLRGHGDSDWPGEYSLQLMCDDVVDALDQIGLDTITLVGHSLGGAVAYLLAMHHPDRVQRLIVEEATPPFRRHHPVPDRPKGVLEFDWGAVPDIVGQINAGDPVMWDGLSGISAPTLLIGGGQHSHLPQDKLHEVAQRIPRCHLITLPSGHNVHATRPSEFTDVVMRWLVNDER
jgi:pimeloyl-ACP methyl ester carboxylesterase